MAMKLTPVGTASVRFCEVEKSKNVAEILVAHNMITTSTFQIPSFHLAVTSVNTLPAFLHKSLLREVDA